MQQLPFCFCRIPRSLSSNDPLVSRKIIVAAVCCLVKHDDSIFGLDTNIYWKIYCALQCRRPQILDNLLGVGVLDYTITIFTGQRNDAELAKGLSRHASIPDLIMAFPL